MFVQTWLLPLALLAGASLLAFPLSRYCAWIMDGKCRPLPVLGWVEKRLDTGPQDWKQYAAALLIFNVVLFVIGYLVLALQPWLPLNPDGKGMLFPSTIFNSVASFITNTNLQHYAGDVHLSNFSQIFFCIYNMFLSASVGFCALVAIIRAFRGDSKVGNYFVDMWRVVVYLFVPAALAFGLIFMSQGSPMTLKSSFQVATLEPAAMGTTDKGEAKQQTIVVGPVAALESIFRKPHRAVELFRHAGHDGVPVRAGADVRPDAGPVPPWPRHLLGHAAAHGRHRGHVDLL